MFSLELVNIKFNRDMLTWAPTIPQFDKTDILNIISIRQSVGKMRSQKLLIEYNDYI